MQIEISNSWYDLVRNKTTILLSVDEPMMVLSSVVDGNVTDKTKEELKNLALDYIYKLLFVDKALPEYIQKVDNSEKKIEEMKELMAEMQGLVEQAQDSEKALDEKIETIKGILLELDISEEAKKKLQGHDLEYINASSTNLYDQNFIGLYEGGVWQSKFPNNGNTPTIDGGWWTYLGTVEEYLASMYA